MAKKATKQDIDHITEQLRSSATVHEMVYKASMQLFFSALIQNELGGPAYAGSAVKPRLVDGDYEVIVEHTRKEHLTVVVRHIPTGFMRHHFSMNLTGGCVRGVTFFSLGDDAPMVTFGGNDDGRDPWYANVSASVEKVAFGRLSVMAPNTEVVRYHLPF